MGWGVGLDGAGCRVLHLLMLAPNIQGLVHLKVTRQGLEFPWCITPVHTCTALYCVRELEIAHAESLHGVIAA